MKEEQNSNKYRKLNILDGIETLHAQNCTVNFPLHKHETYNISLILKNVFRTDLMTNSFLAPTASIAITNPNEFHATPCDTTGGNSFFTFYIPESIIAHLSDNHNFFIEDRVICNQSLFNEFLWLAKIDNGHKPNFEERFLKTLKLLLNRCQVSTLRRYDNSSIKLFIKEIIAETDSFSLEWINTKYGINKYKFIRLFKEEIGLTPKQFFLYTRIEKSKKMLQQGYPIMDVAIRCGFYDSPHFYKYFKQYTGVNPLEFQSAFTD
ncbi:hypothetical protein MTsPCn5_26680 [Croceitalea sp. MTPC5]|uniref:helix-turn-helix domain-containing protein n=1 Tax=Croceitalea sp. MTPC5 TaxID=3056565 RepID=UPI002B3E21F2|nr:hypothetical protein MTsPCn5_26680 [Croceitalea sp. MTPC5]